jgi:hypothetical protein
MHIRMAPEGKHKNPQKKNQLKGHLSARDAYLRDSEEFLPVLAL